MVKWCDIDMRIANLYAMFGVVEYWEVAWLCETRFGDQCSKMSHYTSQLPNMVLIRKEATSEMKLLSESLPMRKFDFPPTADQALQCAPSDPSSH